MPADLLVNFFVIYLCLITVSGWEYQSKSLDEDQIKKLSEHVDNLKDLLSNIPLNNYGHRAPWPYNVNREADYGTYLRQNYILPILNSLKETSEHVKANIRQQQIFVPFPLYPSNCNFGSISDLPRPFYTPVHVSYGGGQGGQISNRRQQQPDRGWRSSVHSVDQSQVNSGSEGFSSQSKDHGIVGGSSLRPFGFLSQSGLYNKSEDNSGQPQIGSISYQSGHDYKSESLGQPLEGIVSGNNYRPFSLRPGPDFESEGSQGQMFFNSDSFSSFESQARPDHKIVPSRFPIVSRYPDVEDPNQNWGLADEGNVQPPTLKPSSKVQPECNCEERSNKKNLTSSALKFPRISQTSVFTCESVILLCCTPGMSEQLRKDCFVTHDCPMTYDSGIACLPYVIRAIFKEIYDKV